MSIPGSALTFLGAASGGDTGYQISRSLRFNEPDSAYLSRTPGGGNRKKWTLSFWYKPALQDTSDRRCILEARNASAHHSVINFRTDDKFEIYHYTTSLQFQVLTTATFRDPSAWYHFVVAYDTDQTGSDKVKIFCNGIRITQFDTASYPSDSYGEALWNDNNTPHTIGRHDSQYLSGYLGEFYWLDGVAPGVSTDDASGSVTGTPSAQYLTDFGEFSTTGVWNPIEYTGSYGTQGYYLDFSNNSSAASLGNDAAGSNNWTVNNLAPETLTGPNTGNSWYFDGTNDVCSVDDSSLALGTGDFTVEYFLKPDTGYNAQSTHYNGTGNYPNFETDGATKFRLMGNQTYGPTLSAGNWYHCAVVRENGACTMWVNGSRVAHNVAHTYDYTSTAHTMGARSGNTYTKGWLSNIHVIVGTAKYSPGSTTIPIPFTPIPNHPNTKLLALHASTMIDGSGQNLSITNNGATLSTDLPSGDAAGTVVTGDSLLDTPTDYQSDSGNNGGNYATLNPLNPRTSRTLSDGNLQLASSANYRSGVATIGITSGKFYFEGQILTDADNGYSMIGITTLPNYFNYSGANGDDDGFGWYSGTGQLYFNDAGGATYSSWTVGDIVSVAYDSATRRTWIAKNGTWQNSGDPAAGTGYVHTSSGTLPVYFSIATGTNGVVLANFGQRPFAYTPPTGFKSLCTKNLPNPPIADGSTVFDVDPYQGTGNTHERSNFSFSPDFLWVKARAGTASPGTQNHYLVDSVRGANGTVTKKLFSNTSGEENAGQTDANNGIDLQSDGFELTTGDDGTNNGNNTYVAWAWDAGTDSSKTYTVTVVSDSGNKYRFDGYGTSAVTLDLEEGSTYVFDQSDSSNATHPLRFATAADAAGGTEYTTGVTVTGTPGQAGAKTTITVASGAPTLYYYCSSHTGMGGQVNTNSTAGASNFDGSIQSRVRANASAGFSIVGFTGTGANSSIGHGLNATPEFIIVKDRDAATGWPIWGPGFVANEYISFSNGIKRTTDGTNYFPSAPTSSVVNLGPWTSPNGNDMIAYCFTAVESYSSFGSYQGNGSTDGPFVFTGHYARFLMIKCSTKTGEDWLMLDTARDTFNDGDSSALYASLSHADNSTSTITTDILSNGFKPRATNAAINELNQTYIYMSFAEYPFKTARAR